MTRSALTLLMLLAAAPVSVGRNIEFSGLTWEVRGWDGAPGNGCWSESTESVWVDDEGALHLRIRKIDGAWCQAEIRATEMAGLGDHTFHVRSRLDELDPGIVLGMFLYDPDAELDIEITGSFESPSQRGWFTVFGAGGELVAQESFDVALSGTFTSHNIRWSWETVAFRSWHGHCAEPPCGGIIHHWSHPIRIGPPSVWALQPRINFWIHRDDTLDRDQEVIISRYDSTPLSLRRRPLTRR